MGAKGRILVGASSLDRNTPCVIFLSMRILYTAAFVILPTLSQAECPANVDITAPLDQAYAELLNAPFPADAQEITQKMWGLWFQAPDRRAQRLLDRGVAHLRAGNLELSEALLTKLVEYCPDYAEGYNQRAFARYLSADFEGALPDLERTLDLLPRHLGAISGKGLTHEALGQTDLAQIEFRKGLGLNPWTSDRSRISDLETDI